MRPSSNLKRGSGRLGRVMTGANIDGSEINRGPSRMAAFTGDAGVPASNINRGGGSLGNDGTGGPIQGHPRVTQGKPTIADYGAEGSGGVELNPPTL